MLRSSLLLLLAFCLFAPATFATTHTSVAFRELNSSFGGCSDSGYNAAGTISEVNCSDGPNDGRARARADYGSLGAHAYIYSGAATDDNGDYQAYALASFVDTLTVDTGDLGAPTDPLGRRYISIELDYHGSGFKNGPVFGEPGSAFSFPSLTVTMGTTESEGRSIGGTRRIYEFFVNVNNPTRMEVELITDVRCFGCDLPYEINSDFYASATFLGLDIEGYDQSQFTVTGSNDRAYGNVVPEPGTAVLVGLGVLGLGFRARSGRSPIA